jgi:hypothetical protein
MKAKRAFSFLAATCTFGGVVCSIVAIIRIENYINPFLFGISCGLCGLLIGLPVGRKLNQLNQRLLLPHLQNQTIGHTVAVSFIGFGMLGGSYLNETISDFELKSCTIIEKDHSERRFRKAPQYYFKVGIDDKIQSITCDYDYWIILSNNDNIRIAYHNSPIGFDYISLPDER